MDGLPMIVAGSALFAMFYLGHGRAPAPDLARFKLSRRITPALRRGGEGEILLTAVLGEAWALLVVTTGALVLGDAIPVDAQADVQLAVLQGGAIIVGGVWLIASLLEVRHHNRM